MRKSAQEIVYGIHAVQAVVQFHPDKILKLLLAHARENTTAADATWLEPLGTDIIETVSKAELDKIAATSHHQGIVAVCQPLPQHTEAHLWTMLAALPHAPLLLILDEVQDPHNLGACLRVADAAQVDAVIVPKHASAPLSPTVRKVASGAAESIPLIAVTNLGRTVEKLQQQGVWVWGLDEAGEQSIYQAKLTGATALVLGSEGSGLRRLTRTKCDGLLHIPMGGYVSSLNVSVASGVCLFEAVRQRHSSSNFNKN
jgi:23S rRNA (guanosine2251-2'-O)-methyltransferase